MSITFTFKNGQGERSDKDGGVYTEPFQYERSGGSLTSGVMIHQEFRGVPCVYGVSAKSRVSKFHRPILEPIKQHERRVTPMGRNPFDKPQMNPPAATKI